MRQITKKIALLCALFVMVAFNVTGQNDNNRFRLDKSKFHNTKNVKNINSGSQTVMMNSVGVSTFIDSMVNAYSFQGSYTNQIYTDPASGYMIITHKGSAGYGSSGKIYYNWTTNGGGLWHRSDFVNTIIPYQAGHPNALIIDSQGIKKPCGTWIQQVDGFGWWKDFSIGNNNIIANIDSHTYSIDAPFINGQNHIFFGGEEKNGEGYWLIKSTDQGHSWMGFDSYMFSSADYSSVNGSFGDFAPDGLHGVFVIEAAPPGSDVYTFMLRTTSDGGITWNPKHVIDKSTIADMPANAHLLMFQNGVTMDSGNNIYLVGTYVDTSVSPVHQIIMIKGTPGNWLALPVAVVNDYYFPFAAGLSTRNECHIARNLAGTSIVLSWIDGTVSGGVTTSLDLFMRGYRPEHGWNGLTVNTSIDNPYLTKFTKLAPRFVDFASNLEAQAAWVVFGGNDTDPGLTSYIYCTKQEIAYPFPGISEDDRLNSFYLLQNYPNPFNPSTAISYKLHVNSRVTLKIYNALGQEIRTLVNETQTAGERTILWDGKDSHGQAVSSGVYFYRLETPSFTKTMKMMMMR